MLLVCCVAIILLHLDIAICLCCFSFLFLFSLFFGFLLIFPLLSNAIRELIVDRHFNVGVLLNQNDAIVEVVVLQSDTKRRVAIDVFTFKLGTTLKNVQRADR